MNIIIFALFLFFLLLVLFYLFICHLGEVQTEYLRRHHVEKSVKTFNHEGTVLEVGSGKKWRYVKNSITLNRDSDTEPDDIGNAECMPFENFSFHTIFCLEVIEHTPEPQKIINEMLRVLKQQGQVLLTVPFMFEVHDKQDYRRFTKQGLEHLFRDYSEVKIYPYGGKFSIICHLIRSTKLGAKTYKFWNNFGNALDKILGKNKNEERFTLGWTVIAKK